MFKHPKYIYGPHDSFVPANLNLGDFLVRNCKKHGDKIAFVYLIRYSTNAVFGLQLVPIFTSLSVQSDFLYNPFITRSINAVNDERLTYDNVAQAAINIAVSLVRIGVKKGDVVAVCSESRPENWSTLMGIACTGAVVTPISIGYIKDELKHIMNISKPKFLFCSKKAIETHEEVYNSLDYVKKIILFDEQTSRDSLNYKDLATVSPNSVIQKNVDIEEFQAVEVDGSDTSCIMYSSGTTGLPKGVMLSHLNIIATCSLSNLCDPNKVVLNIAPWYHAMGLMIVLSYMTEGPPIVFLPNFEINLYLHSIEKYKVNHLVLPPPVLQALIKTNLKYDVSSVETMLCGAAVLQKETIDAVKIKFKNLRDVFQGYGMTEATIIVTIASHVNGTKCKSESVGQVADNTILKIVDVETREPLGPYQNGEICFKSPTLMKGYINHDNKDLLDEEGFFKSGDIGYYDDEKYLYIVDRLKELIKYKGYQVPPAEIETVLMQHPGVREVGVVGQAHPIAGEVPLAFVVTQAGANLTETELQQFVAERLSNPKHLRGGVRFIKEMPRNPNGKIMRNSLRKLVLNN